MIAKGRSSGVATRVRSALAVRGVVQGVGFRPFVYALARDLALAGEVRNTADGVTIEVEGDPARVESFTVRLRTDAPSLARIDDLTVTERPVRGGTGFTIAATDATTPGRTLVAPDVATCADCLGELADPADRRYRHPFISCTNCGPRFTIVVDLPYDRPATTMAHLPLCARCAAEYADPGDRRFHAQTVACPDCGPTLRLVRPGQPDATGDAAIRVARDLLARGSVVAVKGLGGYHLACDAGDETAVATLRKRKDRGDKPFAVLAADLTIARELAELGPAEAALLTDPRRPVVLAHRRAEAPLAPSVAPGQPDVGVLLPYTPVHHLLVGLVGDPPGPRVLVLTSGNRSGEPIVTDDAQALTRLADLADAWLTHDRPIHVPCDDAVVRVVAGRDGDTELPVRRSRGWAPLPVALPVAVEPALAVGGDLKNTFCVGDGRYAWLSAHVGDMDDLATLQAFERATSHLSALTGVRPEQLVADTHPAYRSSAWARRQQPPVRTVQHHHAHIASAMADNGYDGARPVLGFAFDGTGHGTDGAVWGGEVLIADYAGFARVGHLGYVPLPGGDAGVRNPCRMALSHLQAAGVAWDDGLPPVRACSPDERRILERQLATGLHCVPTSSMGRLFDAMSSLADVCHRVAYEAEAAMRFESLAAAALDDAGTPYAFAPDQDGVFAAAPVVAAAAADVLAGADAAVVAARFHLAVADVVVAIADDAREQRGLSTVALSGGVFLNAVLTRLCRDRLDAEGFRVLSHRQVPPSDAGLALGQLVVGARRAHDDDATPDRSHEGEAPPCA